MSVAGIDLTSPAADRLDPSVAEVALNQDEADLLVNEKYQRVLEGLLTSGASAALKSGKAAMIVAKLEKFEVITKNPQLAKAVTKLVQLLEKGKVAEEAVKIEKGLAKTGKAVEGAADLSMGAKKVEQGVEAAKDAKKAVGTAKNVEEGLAAGRTVGGARSGGHAASEMENALAICKKAGSFTACFAPETELLTPEGSKCIADENILSVTKTSARRNLHGSYKAYVDIADTTGAPINKASTMFGDHLSRAEVHAEIYSAYLNARYTGHGNQFIGVSHTGQKIKMYLNVSGSGPSRIISAFPHRI